MGSERAEEYRRLAEEAEARAAAALNAEHRAAYLKLAEAWRKLADQAEGKEERRG
jgi:hypothetical protein